MLHKRHVNQMRHYFNVTYSFQSNSCSNNSNMEKLKKDFSEQFRSE